MKQLKAQILSKAAELVGTFDGPAPQQDRQGAARGAPAGPDPVLEQLLRQVRSKHVRRHFFAHAPSEYTEAKDVRVLAGTYNVAGKRPPPGAKLHEWVGQWRDSWPQVSSGGPGPDIVAVGFQEVVPLNAGNALLGPTSEGADAWDMALAATLNGEEWATRNFGRTYGSGLGIPYNSMERLGSQAAYAYSVISSQAASAVVTAMDKLWVGQDGAAPRGGGSGGGAAADAAEAGQQQARLQAALESGDADDVFVQVASKQMVGLYLSVWVRKRLARHVRGVQTTSAATGWGGYVGNKGAVAARFRVHDSPTCVVCCHLASGDQDGDELRRNADAADILKRCAFPTDAQAAALGLTGVGPSGHWGDMSAISDHQNVIWLGDLNYRISMPDDEARRLIAGGHLEKLLRADQLTREMAAGRAFVGWREGPITFDPTYKYHLGCNLYSGEQLPPGLAAALRAVDSSPSLADSASQGEGGGASGGGAAARLGGRGGSGGGAAAGGGGTPESSVQGGERAGADSPGVEKQKKRTPAWCDRILWLPGHRLHQLAYGRAELMISDHRPVAAAFLLQAHRYDRAAVEALLEEARRRVDASEMANRPRCSLEPKFLDAGVVAYGQPLTLAVSLQNLGSVDASFYYVAPPRPRHGGAGDAGDAGDGSRVTWDDDQPPCPPWLQLAPEEGTVEAGATKELQLTILISGGPSAASLLAAPPAGAPPPKRAPGGGAAAAPAPEASAEGALDCILILRVEDGSDTFISVSGSFVRSAFGRDLDTLAALGPAPAAPAAALGDAARRLRQEALDAGAAAAAAERAAAGAAQAGGGGEEGAAPATPSVGLVPKEIVRLTSFLSRHLSTPGLFVHSHEVACGLPPRGRQPRGQQQVARLLAATAAARWALDTGEPFPEFLTAHQAAATLLALFHQLPDSFMPPSVSAVLMHCVPAYPNARQLVSDSMSPVEWAAARHVLALLRTALAPATAARNGLTVQALAEALSEYWFAGGAAPVPTELAANRIAFLMTLLDPEDAISAGGAADAAAPAAPAAAAVAAAAAVVAREAAVAAAAGRALRAA